jgi:DNA-binding NtrC family response regulator
LKILVVDDAQLSREAITLNLIEWGYRAEAHANPFTALEALVEGHWDLVLTDLRMPSMDGLQFLKEIKAQSPETAVIIMTAYATVESAVEAIRNGALDYLLKPFHMEQLRVHIEPLRNLLEARQELTSLRRTLGATATKFNMVGDSQEMRNVFKQIAQFADRPANVLITGETGTGKEMVARALHEGSCRKNGLFVPVACGAIPRELAESEFFGHEAGAFTGALKRRQGQLELADGGTLFIDDIDDLPLEIQPKLLRAIQEREYQRVGGERLLKSDLRIIASTKKDLNELVQNERFRQDLLYRIQVLTIDLPPLRKRSGDVPLLARHFMEVKCREWNVSRKVISEEAEQKLIKHKWPGNVRELRHAIEYALAVADGPIVQADDFQLRSAAGMPQDDRIFSLNPGERKELNLRELTQTLEKEAILWALKKSHGDQTRAAECLNMPRTTFIYRLQQMGLIQTTQKKRPRNSATERILFKS